MTTQIKTTDFSSSTLTMFNKAKQTKSFVMAFDFARLLIDNDYEVKAVKQFMKANFKNDYQFLDYSI
jgi:hypothetical protein